MKTNVSIELDDQQLRLLADIIDGKQTQRTATRAEIVAIARQHIGGLIGSQEESPKPVLHRDPADGVAKVKSTSHLLVVDPKDRPLMQQPDNPSYVRGWNQVKLSR